MEAIHYEIDAAHITGLSLTPLENVKIETQEPYWEAKANLAELTLTFPESRIHEVRFGIMSSITILVEAAYQLDMSDKVLLFERTEYAAAKGCKMSRYELDKVHPRQEVLFRRVVVTIENLEHDKVLKLAYLGLFRREENHSVDSAIKQKRRLDEPPRPPQKVARTVQPRVTDGVLSDCVVSCLSHSDHVSRLCRALGADYLDYLDESTTHVVLPANLKYDEDALRDTEAKLVSVAWLEQCLNAKTKQREEDFELL